MEKNKTKLDIYQMEALQARHNTVVRAGAGSGKTTVLSERYRSLIIDDKLDPENILTLTFTRKAQGEMYERIYKKLAESQESLHLLANFSKAKISTLDSFCSEIARTGSVHFGIPSNFLIDEDAIVVASEKLSLDFILKNRNTEVLSYLISKYEFSHVWKDIYCEIAINIFLISKEKDFSADFQNQLVFLEKIYLSNISLIEEQLDSLNTENITKALADAVLMIKNKFLDIKNINPFSLDQTDLYDLKIKLCTLFESYSGRMGGTSDDAKILKDILKYIKDEIIADTLFSIIILLENKLFLSGFYLQLNDFYAIWKNEIRKKAVLSFSDTANIALYTLKNDILLRSYYKNKIKAIMIDEFQDNNNLQKELLYLLSEQPDSNSSNVTSCNLQKNKLFFVGDAKQSIYKFRGADVTVFMKLEQEMEISTNKNPIIELKRNYRSEKVLINFFNSIFKNIFTPSLVSSSEQSFDPEYVPQEPVIETISVNPEIIHLKINVTDSDNISALEFDTEKNETEQPEIFKLGAESESFHIAKLIAEKINDPNFFIAKQNSITKQKEAIRPTYDDFAILLRTTTNQRHIEKALSLFNIPFTSLNISSFYSEAPVMDIMFMLTLSVYENSLKAFAGCLRSPFFDISDDGFAIIMLARHNENNIPDEVCNLSDLDSKKYKRGISIIRFIQKQATSQNIALLVSMLWYDFGYRLHVLSMNNCDFLLEYYDYFYEVILDAMQRQLPLISFVDEINGNIAQKEKLQDATPLIEETSGVKLMTIHKSKGLEFPIVIIPFLNSNIIMKKNNNYFDNSEVHGLSLTLKDGLNKINYFESSEKKIKIAQEQAELKRLFYVACTRAESHLIFSSSHKEAKSENAKEPKIKNFYLMLDESLKQCTVKNYTEIERPQVTTLQWYLEKKRNPHKYDEKFYEQVINRNITISEASITEINSYYGNTYKTGNIIYRSKNPIDTSKEIGTLIHNILEHLIKKPQFEYSCPMAIQKLFPANTDINQLIASVMPLAKNFFSTKQGILIQENKVSKRSEMPFYFSIIINEKNIMLKGIIDLIIEYDDFIEVIDFKTNNFVFENEYAFQLSVYKKACERIFKKKVNTYLYLIQENEYIVENEIHDLENVISKWLIENQNNKFVEDSFFQDESTV